MQQLHTYAICRDCRGDGIVIRRATESSLAVVSRIVRRAARRGDDPEAALSAQSDAAGPYLVDQIWTVCPYCSGHGAVEVEQGTLIDRTVSQYLDARD